MSHKTPNPQVCCDVKSCTHNCGDCDNCSLPGIFVRACRGRSSGIDKDESMCGNYKPK